MNDVSALFPTAISCGVLPRYPAICPACHALTIMRLQDAHNAQPRSGPFLAAYMCLDCATLFAFENAPPLLTDIDTGCIDVLVDYCGLLHCPIRDDQRNTPHFRRLIAFHAAIDPETTMEETP